MTSVLRLNPDQVLRFWPQIEGALDAAPELWQGTFSKEMMLAGVEQGAAQIWAVGKGTTVYLVLLTQIFNTPVDRVLQVVWAWGNGLRAAMPQLDAELDRFAERSGCQRIEVIGRKGFERMLRPLGFGFQCATYSRDVQSGRRH